MAIMLKESLKSYLIEREQLIELWTQSSQEEKNALLKRIMKLDDLIETIEK